MPVPTDPILIILTALMLWGFWGACVLHDLLAKRGRKPSSSGGDS